MRYVVLFTALVAIAPSLPAQAAARSLLAHQADFDYLLGDWEFTSVSKDYGANLDRWELISTNGASGLQDFGTGQRVGAEMHIEQRFGVGTPTPSLWRIRYYNIEPDRFSWTADRSTDDGKTWSTEHLKIEARRIGPRRTMSPLAPARRRAP